jgi:hypothetical protein
MAGLKGGVVCSFLLTNSREIIMSLLTRWDPMLDIQEFEKR